MTDTVVAPTRRTWSELLLRGAIFYLLTELSTRLVGERGSVAPLWPPAGLLFGWLLLTARRDWWRVMLLAGITRYVVASRSVPEHALAAGYAVATLSVAMLSAALLRRLAPDGSSLTTVRGVLAFMAIPILVSGPLTGAIGVVVRAVAGSGTMNLVSWVQWWIGDALGVIVAAPVWLTARRVYRWGREAPWRHWLEVVAVFAVVLPGAALVFLMPAAQAEPMRPLLAVIVLPFVLAALRLGLMGVAWSLAPLAVIAAWGTMHGRGVFAALPGERAHHVLILQAYLSVVYVGVLLVAATVDGQRTSLRRLKVSEGKFRRLVDAAPVAMMVAGEDNQSLYVNPALATLVGGTAGHTDTVDAWWKRAFPDLAYRAALRSETDRRAATSAEGGALMPPLPANLVTADGTIRHVELQTVRAGEQQVTTLVDLTERVRAAEATRASEAEFRAIFERAAMPMALVALDGRPMKANPPLCDWLGYSAEELQRMRFTEFTHPDDVHQDVGLFTQLVSGQRDSYQVEKRYRRKDGVIVRGRLTASIVRDRPGVPPYCIAVVEDVTERAQLEMQLRQVQKLEALGTLAGGVAHDFNNILAALVGNLELARQELDEQHRAQEFLGEVERASRRAAELVRQILTFSRRQEQERRTMAVAPVLREATALLRAVVPASVTIEERISPDLPFVIADATQLHQVIMNLATNAVHAMREQGGTMSVALESVWVDEDLGRRVPELHVGPYVRLTVTDTGHGMSHETLDRVFEPFFTTKVAGEGTGLGLAVVHGIVRSHDGAITVTSELGRGTRFVVHLPVSAESPLVVQPAGNEVPPGNGAHVLFVDDEPVLARLAERTLQRFGYRATVVTRAGEALLALRGDARQFDVLVTDLTMPEMSGLQLAAEALRIRPDLPVILATGYSGMLTPETARQRGLRGLLIKPFTPESLARALAQAIHEDAAAA
ncbi:MAG: PAS domain S-box protein [Gemmatimonadetes bacterium]|nr:PAS domain S-box protein [Gemmatimonadota bacterium]